MSRCVSFQNPGVIDPRAWTLFGASAKTGANPIGFFGTGLKYAIAIFLRLGCKVEVWRGLDRVVFDTTEIQMRESNFKVVTASREELGFTTELGKTWRPWQALRELWCNALDEGGEMQPIEIEPREDHTTIRVHGSAVIDAWHERERIMLTSRPRWLSNGVEIHERGSTSVYFRGVRVMDLQRSSRLTYNIIGHPLELTEDRTVKHSFYVSWLVRDAVLGTEDEALAREFLDAPEGSFEHGLDVSDGEPGPVFNRVMDDLVNFRVLGNDSVLRLYRRKRGQARRPPPVEPTALEAEVLERAKRFCRQVGLDVERFPVLLTTAIEQHVLGFADREEGRVYLNRRVFMQGAKMVAGTLMEELIHLQHGLKDETRPLQNFLVDLVVTEYEKRTGVAL